MTPKKLLLIVLLPLTACSVNPYDTSTPENFVTSMGLISERPSSENPIPFFYDKDAAERITIFDETGEKTGVAFDKFRNMMEEKFPDHVKSNQEDRLKIALDGTTGMKTRSFSYSATLIGA